MGLTDKEAANIAVAFSTFDSGGCGVKKKDLLSLTLHH